MHATTHVWRSENSFRWLSLPSSETGSPVFPLHRPGYTTQVSPFWVYSIFPEEQLAPQTLGWLHQAFVWLLGSKLRLPGCTARAGLTEPTPQPFVVRPSVYVFKSLTHNRLGGQACISPLLELQVLFLKDSGDWTQVLVFLSKRFSAYLPVSCSFFYW